MSFLDLLSYNMYSLGEIIPMMFVAGMIGYLLATKVLFNSHLKTAKHAKLNRES